MRVPGLHPDPGLRPNARVGGLEHDVAHTVAPALGTVPSVSIDAPMSISVMDWRRANAHPACLSKQKMMFFDGSRLHHSLP